MTSSSIKITNTQETEVEKDWFSDKLHTQHNTKLLFCYPPIVSSFYFHGTILTINHISISQFPTQYYFYKVVNRPKIFRKTSPVPSNIVFLVIYLRPFLLMGRTIKHIFALYAVMWVRPREFKKPPFPELLLQPKINV